MNEQETKKELTVQDIALFIWTREEAEWETYKELDKHLGSKHPYTLRQGSRWAQWEEMKKFLISQNNQ